MQLYKDDLGLDLASDNSQLFAMPSSEAPGIGLSPEQGWVPPASIGIGDTQDPAPISDGVRQPVASPISRVDFRNQILERMSAPEKFFTAVGEFGAGVQGKPSPFNERMRSQLEERALQATELKANVGLLHESVAEAQKLDGDARKKYVEAIAPQLDANQPGMGAALRTFADNPGMLTKLKDIIPKLPPHLQDLAKADPSAFIKIMSTTEGLKELHAGYDAVELNTASKKAKPILVGYQHIASPDLSKRITDQGYMTASQFNDIQDALPESHPAKMTDAQRQAASKSETFYQSLGVVTPKEEAEIRKKQAEDKGKRETIEIGVGGDQFQKAYVEGGQVVEMVGQPYKKKEGVTVNMPGFAQLVTKDGVPGVLRIGKNGKEEFLPNVSPAPKDQDPLKKAIADALGGKPAAKVDAVKPVASSYKSADDVRKAFLAGRLTRDQAKGELKQFGFE